MYHATKKPTDSNIARMLKKMVQKRFKETGRLEFDSEGQGFPLSGFWSQYGHIDPDGGIPKITRKSMRVSAGNVGTYLNELISLLIP